MVDRDMSLEEFHRTRHAEIQMYLLLGKGTERGAQERAADKSRADELLRQHFLYLWELEEQGKLFGAGPVDAGTPNQEGLFIVAAASREEAEQIAANEPFQKAGWRSTTIRTWQLNEGLGVPLGRELAGKRQPV